MPKPAVAVVALGVAAGAVALALHTTPALAAADQAGPAFLLVTGLLLIGASAAAEGLFARAGQWLTRMPLGSAALVTSLLLLEAAVTAVLNLDTAVVFLTPVLVQALRHRRMDCSSLVYGSLLMANAASLLLPGSNLTNIIVLRSDHVASGDFALAMLTPWCVSVACCIGIILCFGHRGQTVNPEPLDDPPVRRGGLASMLAIGLAVAFMLALANPAVPVLLLGVATAGAQLLRRRLAWTELTESVDWRLIVGLCGISVAIGCLAREWPAPQQLLAHATAPQTALLAAGLSIALNNLPASLLLASHPVAHWQALLLGLDLGPNLAVSGSLAALLWLGSLRVQAVQPRLRTLAVLGAAQCTMAVGIGLWLSR